MVMGISTVSASLLSAEVDTENRNGLCELEFAVSSDELAWESAPLLAFLASSATVLFSTLWRPLWHPTTAKVITIDTKTKTILRITTPSQRKERRKHEELIRSLTETHDSAVFIPYTSNYGRHDNPLPPPAPSLTTPFALWHTFVFAACGGGKRTGGTA